jgi:hypothetical protein
MRRSQRLVECARCGALATEIAAGSHGWRWRGTVLCCHRCLMRDDAEAGRCHSPVSVHQLERQASNVEHTAQP